MSGSEEDNTLVLGGFKFSKIHNRKKGVLVTSIDPDDTTTKVVVSSTEESDLNESSHGNEDKRKKPSSARKMKGTHEIELQSRALMFCRVVNKLLQKQNTSSFAGYEAIYKMVSSGLCKNRAEALALGKDLSKKLRLFYRVEFKRNTFSDDGKLYKFRPEVLLSVIMKSPMSVQKLTPLDQGRKTEKSESKPNPTSDLSYSPMKFRKFVPKKDLQESKKEEITLSRNKITHTPKKKGKRSKEEELGKAMDQMHMIPQDQSPSSEEDWRKPTNYGQRSNMESNRERRELKDDDNSICTEVTATDHKNDSSFPPVPSLPRYEDDEASYMDITVSTRGANSNHDTYSYFEEYTLHDRDEDEYNTMTVPTTPVVRQKFKVRAKSNAPSNDIFSPKDVTSFDRSAKSYTESSLSGRMKRGELDIEVPDLNENEKYATIIEDI